ncbi:sigma-70 family RNA polymerase sigma factor [Peptostreptococcaceae bacterium AGR-M142]
MHNKKDENYLIAIKFIRENQEYLYKLAYIYVKNEQDALDVVQDTIYKIITKIDKLKNIEYLKTWSLKILKNTAINFLRKNKKEILMDLNIEKSYEEELDINIDLYDVLKELSDEEQRLIELRFFKDLKINEVSKEMNVNLNTVKTRLYKTLKKMKVLIEGRSLK